MRLALLEGGDRGWNLLGLHVGPETMTKITAPPSSPSRHGSPSRPTRVAQPEPEVVGEDESKECAGEGEQGVGSGGQGQGQGQGPGAEQTHAADASKRALQLFAALRSAAALDPAALLPC